MLIRRKWRLALALGLLVSPARAEDPGWGSPAPVALSPPAVTLGRPILAGPAPACSGAPAGNTTLGKPIPLGAETGPSSAGILDRQIHRTAYSNPSGAWVTTVRARGDDPEGVQPVADPAPDKPAPINRLFTWTPATSADEMAPPPRVDTSANPGTPPRVSDFFPPAQQVLPYGGAPPPPPFAGGPPGPPAADGLSLSTCGTYPGNELYIKGETLIWWAKGAPVPPLGTTFSGTTPTATSGLPSASGTTVLLGDDHYAGGTRGGARVMAGYWFDDAHLLGIEGGFLILGKTTTTQNFSSLGPTNLAIPFVNAATGAQQVFPIAGINVNPFTGAPVGDVGSLQMRYSSSLYGYEVNLRGVCCQGPFGFIDGLVGFRGLGLDESLNLTATTSATSLGGGLGTQRIIGDNFSVQNRFYGAQIGTIMETRVGCWVIDLTGKLGMGCTQEVVNIAGSTVDQRTFAGSMAYPTGFFAQPTNAGRHQQSAFTVVPEVGVTVGYQITPRLRAFAGYNFLYWSRVVRPADQIDQTVNMGQLPKVGGTAFGVGSPAAPVFVFHQTDYWAQGVTLGLEWRY